MKLKFTSQYVLPCDLSGPPDHVKQDLAYSNASALEYVYVAPRTRLEDLLTCIWSQILGIEHIGVKDCFQDLGGHSLHATQILARLKSDLGVNFPRSLILEAPTIEQMATCIEADHCLTRR